MSVPNDPTQGLPTQGPHDGANTGAAALSPTVLPDQPGEDHSRNQSVPTAPDGQTAPPFQPGQAATAKNASDALPAQSENVRWVEVNNVGGWPAMSKTLRDYDEEKVKDCKEDVDTLLVFAGLYSAVLSAFTIESYQNLQPDTKDEIVFVLRHMATQSYTFNAGFLNATAPIPDLPPFEPPLWAVRVNVLWFASLVFSLAAASLGMLVKQWLREFLAMDYTSPQQRLRARQYREPSLKTWKVYEIAAILPLLLQIALGLFFVGLCYFTAQIHSSVAHTTLPLVCGWVFFFLMTTVAPLISPRCPFKTTLLKNVMRSSRQHGFILIKGCMKVFIVVNETSTSRFIANLLSLLLTSLRAASSIIFRSTRSLIGGITGVFRKLLVTLDQAQQNRLADLLVREPEEDEVIKKDSEDTEMLLAVDSVMPGNTFLPTILDAYKSQNLGDAAATGQFVLNLVGNRTLSPLALDGNQLRLPPNLRSLSKQDWEALLDTVSETPPNSYDPVAPTSAPQPWERNALLIVLSESKYNLRGKDFDFLSLYMMRGPLPHILRAYPGDLARKTKLLIQVVQHWAGEKTPTGTLTASMNLGGLEEKAWQSIAIAAADVLQHIPGDIGPDSEPWARHLVHLLLSHTPFHLPDPAKQVLAKRSFHSHSFYSFLHGMHVGVAPSESTQGSDISRIRRLLTHYIFDRATPGKLVFTTVHHSIWEVLVSAAFTELEKMTFVTGAPQESSPSWIGEAASILFATTDQPGMPQALLDKLRQSPGTGRVILCYGAQYLQDTSNVARAGLLHVSVEALCSVPFGTALDLRDFEGRHWRILMEYVARLLVGRMPLDPDKPDVSPNYVDVLLSRHQYSLPEVALIELNRVVMHSSHSIAYLLHHHSRRSKGPVYHDLSWVINRLFQIEVGTQFGSSQIPTENETERIKLIETWFTRFPQLVANPPALVRSILTLLAYLSSSNNAVLAELSDTDDTLYSRIPLLPVERWKNVTEMLVAMLDQSFGTQSSPSHIPSWLVHTVIILMLSTPEEPLRREVIGVVVRSWKIPGFCTLLGKHIVPEMWSHLNMRFAQICGNPDVLNGCLTLYASAFQRTSTVHSSLSHFLDTRTHLDESGTIIAEHLSQFLLQCSQRIKLSWYGQSWYLSREVLLAVSRLSTRVPNLRDRAVEVFAEVFKSDRLPILFQLSTVSSEDGVHEKEGLYTSAFAQGYKDNHRMLLILLNDHLSKLEAWKTDIALDPLRLCTTYINIIRSAVDGCVDCRSKQALFHDGLDEDEDLLRIWTAIWDRLKPSMLYTPSHPHLKPIGRDVIMDALKSLRSLKDNLLQIYPEDLETSLDGLVEQLHSNDSS